LNREQTTRGTNTSLAGEEREGAAPAEEGELDGVGGEEGAGDADDGDDEVLEEAGRGSVWGCGGVRDGGMRTLR
jgi:hypothetical protein